MGGAHAEDVITSLVAGVGGCRKGVCRMVGAHAKDVITSFGFGRGCMGAVHVKDLCMVCYTVA